MEGRARFAARGLNYGFVFLDADTLISVGTHTVGMRFAGADPQASFEGVHALPARSNYIHGERNAWRFGVPNFERLLRKDVYPGIDVVYYGNGQELEYDFIVRPGADARVIRLQFTGASQIRLDADGDLVLEAGDARMTQRRPLVYQTAGDGSRQAISSSYVIRDGEVRFALADYDRSRPVTVDPSLVFSQFVGGSVDDIAIGVGRDANGLYYVAGSTVSIDFALAGDSYATSNAGDYDVFVAVVDPTQNVETYSTYVGGSDADKATGMAVTAAGVVYVTGSTVSTNFPTANAFQSNYKALGDGFLFALDTTQSGTGGLLYSTYFGGSQLDVPFDLTVDARGLIYVTGRTFSRDFPVGPGSLQPALEAGDDAFVLIFDLNQTGSSSLVYASYFGGDRSDIGRSIAVDAAGRIYLAGSTFSDDLPVSGNAYDRAFQEGGDAFLAVIDLSQSSPLVYCTYFGGSDLDEFMKVRLDAKGRVVLAGYTLSTDLPLTLNAAQAQNNGETDAIVVVFDLTQPPSSQLVYSTYFGGSSPEVALDCRIDAGGKIWITGFTQSTDFSVTPAAFQPAPGAGGTDGFITGLNPSTLLSLSYSSFIGGAGYNVIYAMGIDSSGNLYVAGSATSDLLTGTNYMAAGRVSDPGNADAFIMVLNPN